MKLFKLIVPALFTVAIAACGGKNNSESAFTVEGVLAGGENKTLYIEEMTPDNGPQFIDSIKCDKKGHFSFSTAMPYQTFYNLHATQYDFVVLLPSAGETIKINGRYDALGESYTTSGSEGSQQMWTIQQHINESKEFIASLAQAEKANKENLNEQEYARAHAITDSLFIEEYQVVFNLLHTFITDNQGSLATLYAIDAPFNSRNRVFDANEHFSIFEEVLDGLVLSQPDNPHTQYFKMRVERERSRRELGI